MLRRIVQHKMGFRTAAQWGLQGGFAVDDGPDWGLRVGGSGNVPFPDALPASEFAVVLVLVVLVEAVAVELLPLPVPSVVLAAEEGVSLGVYCTREGACFGS